MKRFCQSAKQALSKTGIYLGLFSVVLSIIGIIGYEDLIGDYVYRFICAVGIFLLAYIVALFKCYLCNSVSVQLGGNKIVVIGYGDFFSKQGVIVIPFNRFFDTEVNEDILSQRSMAGLFIKNAFPGNVLDLDRQISSSIKDIVPDTHHNITKPGKRLAYPIGTVAKVQKGANDYFCVALTDVDANNKSICDIEMLHKTMIELLGFIDREANGQDVYMPVLGSGFSRLNKDKQVILEYLISILKTTNIPIQSKLHIVLRETDRESINLTKHF